MKSLKIIQKIAYVAWIVSLVLSCLAFTAAGFTLLGAIVVGTMQLLMNVNWIYDILVVIPIEIRSASVAYLIAESIVTAGHGVILFFLHRYLTNERKDGTPFTYRGAKEVLILGIITAAVPLAAVSTSTTIAWIGGISINFSDAVDMTPGLLMVFMSFVFRYGADLSEKAGETNEPEDKAAVDQPAEELPVLTEETTDKENN